MQVHSIVSGFLCLVLTGCAITSTAPPTPARGVSITGNVHGGQQPVMGSHIYLMAANNSGYGSASISLLAASSTGHADSVGAYVLSDANGAFSITGDYSCVPGTQVYVYVLGGDPGAGSNSALGLLAVLGQCPAAGSFLGTTPFLWVNEVSTIAAAYALSGFATDATHVSSSGTALAQIGMANAFANAANLADISTGVARATTPGGNGIVPQAQVNTLANIIASCINSSGPSSTSCSTLLRSTLPSDSNNRAPVETASAAINIAHNPGGNISTLYLLSPPKAPFAPALATQPPDFAIGLKFTGGGISGNAGTSGVAIDGSGNAWITNAANNNLTELSSSGAAISPSTGFTGGGLNAPSAVAIDPSGNVWVTNKNASVSEFSSAGTAISSSSGFTGGGLLAPSGIAIDGVGDVWVTNNGSSGGIAELSNSGMPISPPSGYADAGVFGLAFSGIAIDPSGNAWITLAGGNNAIAELSNAGATLSPGYGFTGAGLYIPHNIAIDNAGNVWSASAQSLTKFSSAGQALSTPPGFTGQGVISDSILVSGLAIDGGGNAWVGLYAGITELSNTGTLLLLDSGSIIDGITAGPRAIAVDGSGDVWVTNVSSTLEYIGAAVPVVTPTSAGVKNKTLGARP